MNSRINSPVLLSEFSRLSPDIFLHPIWINFGGSQSIESSQTIKGILDEVQIVLKEGDQFTACQLLFVCAVIQNRLDDQDAALNTNHKALELAINSRLPQVECWALWALSALKFQRGALRETAEYLNHLQEKLYLLGDWTLGNVIDLICQYLQQVSDDGSDHFMEHSSTMHPDPMLREILEGMNNWGSPPSIYSQDDNGSNNRLRKCELDRPGKLENGLFSWKGKWRNFWHTFRRVLKGELRLEWVETEGQALTEPWIRSDGSSSTSGASVTSSESLPNEQYKIPETGSLSHVDDSKLSQLNLLKKDAPSDLEMSILTRTESVPSLAIYFLGSFKVYKNDQLIENWMGIKSKQIFKYLVNHRQNPVHHDILVDLFWPDVDPEIARRNLYQAVYSLRQALQTGEHKYPYILTEENHYRLNPELDLWIDNEVFRQHYLSAQVYADQDDMLDAIKEYELAENLYQGEFLAEDRYEDWPVIQRENLRHDYLHILDQLSHYYFDQGQYGLSVNYCQKILAEDNCREDAHQMLIRCYLRQGQHHLAPQQYHLCVETLKRELDVPPMQTTVDLLQEIKEARFNFPQSEN